jgi:predicted AlkP superfamily phosphohydrolase/phosphomutase/tetratricopeptide (TPR) repeat protein
MSKRKMLLVGWDAADWKVLTPLIDGAELPVFTRAVVENGVIGDMSTLEPALSPLLWNSIATGKRSDRHGVLGFTEVDSTTGRVRPVSSTCRTTKALWNILSQQELRTNVAGWFASHPAEPIRGSCISDAFARGCPEGTKLWPLLPGTIYPPDLASAMERLRIGPGEIDQEILRLFVPKLEEIDRSKPNRLGMLARILAECFTIHAAATWLMENSAWDFMAVYYIGIDHFSHGFMNFHPPLLRGVDEKEFELYKDVVSGGYRLMDLFLGRLLQLAGPDTTVLVVSDHGFHSDHLRPRQIPQVPTGPATQHRPLGMFGIAGPGIRRDERIYGAGLLDIAPTVLALFGLPAGEDMPGRVLSEVFETPPGLDRIASWDAVDGESGMHPPGLRVPMEDADELIQQFVALGYIAEQPEDRDLAAAACRQETQWNLVRVYTGTYRFAEALPVLEELCHQAPARGDFALALSDCQLRLGLFEEALGSATAAVARHPNSPVGCFVLGQIAFAQKRFPESLSHFLEAERLGPPVAGLHANIGVAYLKLRRWSDAERAFAKALEIDPHLALASQGMARICLREGRAEEAARFALSSLSCRHDLPLSHFWLGVALTRLGRRERAIQAFEMSLSFPPPLRISHRMLAALHGNTPKGRIHAKAAQDFVARARTEDHELKVLRQEARKRGSDRAIAANVLPAEKQHESALDFTIVSGLPRSGTSLMMRILEAAGLPVMSDGLRGADDDNPGGYYEWEAIKKVGTQPAVLSEARGKVVKVVSMLLPSLPEGHRYNVIFMDRPVEEIVMSQRKMLENRGAAQLTSQETMARALSDHRSEILRGLHNAPGFEVLVVDYPALVNSPEEWLCRVQRFLGIAAVSEAMRSVVRQDLYRNRASRL